jgi:serine/threonine protein kinase
VVAIKKIRLEQDDEGIPSTTLREISSLKELDHENIIKLEEVIYKPLNQKLYLVFEYFPMDLRKFIWSRPDNFELKEVLHITRQILEALYHCHTRRIIHRDIKPQNILIDNQTLVVKVADFGLARVFSIPLKALTHEIETLWYWAPEVLLGLDEYCLGVDTWPVGCIIAELILKKPLFRGDSEIDQIFKILQMFGTP